MRHTLHQCIHKKHRFLFGSIHIPDVHYLHALSKVGNETTHAPITSYLFKAKCDIHFIKINSLIPMLFSSIFFLPSVGSK